MLVHRGMERDTKKDFCIETQSGESVNVNTRCKRAGKCNSCLNWGILRRARWWRALVGNQLLRNVLLPFHFTFSQAFARRCRVWFSCNCSGTHTGTRATCDVRPLPQACASFQAFPMSQRCLASFPSELRSQTVRRHDERVRHRNAQAGRLHMQPVDQIIGFFL